jgi:UDP-N-acetylmuramate dehydrogenase
VSIETLVELAGSAAHEHAPFGARTTYRVGGNARLLIEVENLDALARYSRALRECALPIVILGNGSNLLVADDEFAGVVLVLGTGFGALQWHDEATVVKVHAGACLDLPVVARRLSDDGVRGFEWAVGVPGTLGGAAVMNAGGHGSDMAHSVVSLRAWSLHDDQLHTWTLEDLRYGYRQSALSSFDIVIDVDLDLVRGSRDDAQAMLRDIVRWRREHQPGGANAGSVFRNAHHAAAGALIEAAGLKGHRHGSAYVSEKHANFIQVDAGGRSSDVVALMKEIREAVRSSSGVTLVSELRTVGFEGQWP